MKSTFLLSCFAVAANFTLHSNTGTDRVHQHSSIRSEPRSSNPVIHIQHNTEYTLCVDKWMKINHFNWRHFHRCYIQGRPKLWGLVLNYRSRFVTPSLLSPSVSTHSILVFHTGGICPSTQHNWTISLNAELVSVAKFTASTSMSSYWMSSNRPPAGVSTITKSDSTNTTPGRWPATESQPRRLSRSYLLG